MSKDTNSQVVARYSPEGPDVQKINHLEALEELLESCGVDKTEICLIGSAPLAVWGIRENRDIDFIATENARELFHLYANKQPDSRVDSDKKIFFSEEIELTRPNRLETIGLNDFEVINNHRNHYVLEGWKILRLEVAISRKYAHRRPKDFEDIERIESSGIIGSDHWDWDVPVIVAPWDRPPGKSLIQRGIHSLRTRGVIQTAQEALALFWENLPSSYTDPLAAQWHSKKQRRRFSAAILDEVELRYPIPNLLAKQYDSSGTFCRYDLVAAVIAHEESDDTVAEAWTAQIDTEQTHSVSITPNGMIHSGLDGLARKIVERDGLSDPSTGTVPVSVEDDDPLSPRTIEWVRDTFPQDTVDFIQKRKQTLLVETGTTFVAILWPGLREHFDDVESIIRSRVDVIQTDEYELENGLDSFITDIYSVDQRAADWRIKQKIHELRSYNPTIRVLTFKLSDPDFRPFERPRLSRTTHDLKYDIRQEYQEVLENYVYDVTVHITDNYTQNAHVATVLSRIEDGVYSPLSGADSHSQES